MASQAAALRDEPHDSQASKKPLRKQIKRALEQMTAEQMEAESKQQAVLQYWGHSRRFREPKSSYTACMSHINGVAPDCGRGSHSGQVAPKAVQRLCRQGVWLSLGCRTITIACESAQAARSAPGSWHSPFLSTLGGWACSCTAPAYKRSTLSRWSRPRLQQVRLSTLQLSLFESPICTPHAVLPHPCKGDAT